MKVSIFMDHLRDISVKKACSMTAVLKEAKKCGVDYVELNAGSVSNREDLLRQLNAADLKVGGLYYMFDFTHKAQPDERRAVLELAEYLHADNVMAVPGFINPEDDAAAAKELAVNELNELCAEAAMRGLRVTMEDFDSDRSPCGTAEELLWFFERVPRLGCTFDTGNFIYHGQDVLKAYDLLEPHICHVHMKDRGFAPLMGETPVVSLKKKKLYPAPVGSGELPMAEIVRRLYERGYDGLFAMEHFGATDQLMFMRRSARWMKNIFR